MKGYADGGEVQKDDDKESSITQAIRDYVLGHGGLGGTDQKDFQTAMNVDTSSGSVKGYAEGGIVMPPFADLGNIGRPAPWDVENMSSTIKGAAPAPPVTAPPPQAGPPSDYLQGAAEKMSSGAYVNPVIASLLAMPHNGGATGSFGPAAPVAAPRQAPAAPTPTPGIADVLGQAQGTGSQVYGAYTPEKRNELYAYLASRANSMPSAIGNSLASVGDAISKGYGRSDSDHLNQSLQSQKQGREEAMGAFDAAQKGHLGEVQTGMDLQKTDPHSAISKIYQQSFAHALKNLGYSAADIPKLPASTIEAVSEMGIKYADIQSQNLLKQATIGVSAMTAKANIANQQQERQEAEAKLQAEHPIQSRLGMLSPLFGGNSESPTTRTLNGQNFVKIGGNWYHQ